MVISRPVRLVAWDAALSRLRSAVRIRYGLPMPFKSKAQRRKFAHLLVEGQITDKQYEEWNRSTGRKDLPERLHRKTTTSRKKSTGSRKKTAPRRKAAPRKKA